MSGSGADVLVLGAGPAGLGAARALHAAGRDDWLLLEREAVPGGLARSFRDERGFTWDLGGHVIFSRLDAFNRMLDEALPGGFYEHERRAFIHLNGGFVPYPFQNNIHRLPEPLRAECLAGLAAAAARRASPPPANFDEWIERSFGRGVAEVFMRPYNRKVWRCEPAELAVGWVGERVARPEPAKVLEGARAGRDDDSWGPNRTFRFPKSGGTGAIWSALARTLSAEKLCFGAEAAGLDLDRRECRLAGGGKIRYRRLVSTLPLDQFVRLAGAKKFANAAGELRHTAVTVLGLGFAGRPPEHLADKCWIYFPDPAVPWYRMTVFSNYSPANVPEPGAAWSLMLEAARRPEDPAASDPWPAVRGALAAAGLVPPDVPAISVWTRDAPYAYPVPMLSRDAALADLLPALEQKGVISCGRFGAWRYELGNMDHCFAQGLDAAARILAEAGP